MQPGAIKTHGIVATWEGGKKFLKPDTEEGINARKGV